MSRFLVFSDLHLNCWTYGDHGTGGNARLGNQLDFLDLMFSYAIGREIKYLLFCGDFFHTQGHIKTEVIQSTLKTLQKIKNHGVEIIYIAGNHDQADKKGSIHPLDLLEPFGQYVHEKTVELPGLPPVCGLDYTENADKLEDFLRRIPKGAIVLLHQGVSGVEVNSKGFTLNEILKPEMIPDHVMHVFAGHYHSHKRVSDKLTIPGAPMQFNWGDAGEDRGFLDVMIEGDNIHTKFISSKLHCYGFKKIIFSPSFNYRLGSFTNRLGSFTKIIGVPDKKRADEHREYLFKHGVNTVEIEYASDDSEREEIESSEFDSFDKMFEEYVKDSEIDGRRLEVGKEVMAGNYETPELQS